VAKKVVKHALHTPEKMTVVAELRLTYDGKTEMVRSFDKAWHRMREIGRTTTPVNCRLMGFVRKSDEELKDER
jgi:hypothetical protein